MAEVQTQPNVIPVTTNTEISADKDALISRLDDLLEQYLHTLDAYQKARELLSKQLSSGYLSLAQANFQNRSTSHYGKDSYDERMQVIRTINVNEEDVEFEEPKFRFSVSFAEQKAEDKSEAKVEDETLESSDARSGPEEKPSPGEEGAKDSNKVKDPIRWFGILVPPALRSAQASFISGVEGPIPQLATIARDLRTQEIEIGRVRKQIKKL